MRGEQARLQGQILFCSLCLANYKHLLRVANALVDHFVRGFTLQNFVSGADAFVRVEVGCLVRKHDQYADAAAVVTGLHANLSVVSGFCFESFRRVRVFPSLTPDVPSKHQLAHLKKEVNAFFALKRQSEANALFSDSALQVLRELLQVSSAEVDRLLEYFGDLSFRKQSKWKGFFRRKPTDKSEAAPGLPYAVLETRDDQKTLRSVLIIFFQNAHFFRKLGQIALAPVLSLQSQATAARLPGVRRAL